MGGKVWITMLGVALVVALGWGFMENQKVKKLEEAGISRYTRALKDFASHLDEMETDFAKGKVASTAGQQVLYLSQIGTLSQTAVKDLAQLPAEENGLSYVSEYLNRAGDFSTSLAYRISLGQKATPEEEAAMAEIHTRLLDVNDTVQELVRRVDTEGLAWVDKETLSKKVVSFILPGVAEAAAEAAAPEEPSTSVRSGLDQLNASLQKLPPITYVGEFESRTVPEPLGLPKEEVDQEAATQAAQEFLKALGYSDTVPEMTGLNEGPLGFYTFNNKDFFLTISKRGGEVLIYRDQREIGERTLEPEEGIKKAEETLKALGWNLILTSKEDFGSFLQLEYVLDENGVRYYADKVRLTVGLDKGQITGMDTTPYYAFHTQRNLSPKLSVEEAAKKLRPGFAYKETRLAVIPVTGNREVITHEYRGMHNGEEYLVYINAVDGTEEKIKRIIKTPRGEYLQ